MAVIPDGGSALCRICVPEKWDACHISNVRNDENGPRCPRSDRGRLHSALTALVPTTHVGAMGCVHHPGRREIRRRRARAQGSCASWNENRRSVDLRCDPGAPRPGRARRSCDHNATPLDPSNNRTDDNPDSHTFRPRARCRRQRRRPRARPIRHSGDGSGAQPLRPCCPSAPRGSRLNDGLRPSRFGQLPASPRPQSHAPLHHPFESDT